MVIEEFCRNLAERVAGSDPEMRLPTAAAEVGGFFNIKPHEVAFFTVDASGRSLNFSWPPSVAEGRRVPLKAFNSVVAATANEQRTFLDNSFATTRHLYMFEHLLVDKNERIAVQKLMSVPILVGETATGVIQVARKGATPVEAGNDFTQEDLSHLERIAAALAGVCL